MDKHKKNLIIYKPNKFKTSISSPSKNIRKIISNKTTLNELIPNDKNTIKTISFTEFQIECVKNIENSRMTIPNYEKNVSRTDTLRLTQEFNEKFFRDVGKNIEITPFSIMRDDIKNYRTLTDIQLKQLEDFTEIEKIEIIKIYNEMFYSLDTLI